MLKAPQLLRRAAIRSSALCEALAGTQQYAQRGVPCRSFHIRRPRTSPKPHQWQHTFNASSTVLDIDAANNEHVVPIIREPSQNSDAELRALLRQRGAKDIPRRLISDDGARWISENLEYFRNIRRKQPEIFVAAGKAIDNAIEQLKNDGRPVDLSLCALAFRFAPLKNTITKESYLRRVAHLMQVVQANGYTWNLQRDGSTSLTLSLEDKSGDCTKTEFLADTSHGIRKLMCSEGDWKLVAAAMIPPVKASIRDSIQSKDQYMEYLQMLLTMGGVMESHLRKEWFLERNGEWLSSMPCEVAVAMVAAFLPESRSIAAGIVERWAAGEGRSVSDFFTRFDDDFDILVQRLHWYHDQHLFKAGVHALLPDLRNKPSSDIHEQSSESTVEEAVAKKGLHQLATVARAISRKDQDKIQQQGGLR